MQTTDHYDRVKEFMVKGKQVVRDKPDMPSESERALRANLILEEALETVNALGCSLTCSHSYGAMLLKNGASLSAVPTHEPDLVKIADGCADIMVVTTGTLVAAGIPDVALQNLVDQNNLAKLGPGHIIREDGKVIKPPDHTPPDIRGLLTDITHASY